MLGQVHMMLLVEATQMIADCQWQNAFVHRTNVALLETKSRLPRVNDLPNESFGL